MIGDSEDLRPAAFAWEIKGLEGELHSAIMVVTYWAGRGGGRTTSA